MTEALPPMRIALLKADYVNDDLLTQHGDLTDMFGRFLARAFSGRVIEVRSFEVRHLEYPSVKDVDLIVISGSRYSVNDGDTWIARLIAFIQENHQKVPFVGFCFGHQILAKALGGSVGKTPAGRNLGVRPISLLNRPAWMGDPVPQIHALFNHGEQVLTLPPGAERLAGDDNCHVQIFRIKRDVLGFQFHPEYTLDYQESLMLCQPQPALAARQDALHRNRTLPRNDELAASWIRRFIQPQHSPLPIRLQGHPMVRAIISDFDGTLFDTQKAISAVLLETFKQRDHVAPSLDQIEATISRGITLEETLEELIPALAEDHAARNAWVIHYREIYNAGLGIASSVPFPGLGDTLAELKERGIPVIIVSNKGQAAVWNTLKHFEVDHLVSLVIAAHNDLATKPNPDSFFQRIQPAYEHLTPDQFLVFGDTATDLKYAQAVGAKSALAAYGYGKKADCLSYQPHFVFENMSQLLTVL